MISTINIDIFKNTTDAIIHQANCHNRMLSGVAAGVSKYYPEAVKIDDTTKAGDINKLGTFSFVQAKDGKYIYNLYGQYNYGVPNRNTNYEAFYNGLSMIHEHMILANLKNASIPYKIGSDRGGASWNVISAMIYDIFDTSDIDLYICKYTP